MADVRYPKIKVELSGGDGNAFMILGKMQRAMQKVGVSQEKIDEFKKEAKSGDYDHLLQTCMKWVEIS